MGIFGNIPLVDIFAAVNACCGLNEGSDKDVRPPPITGPDPPIDSPPDNPILEPATYCLLACGLVSITIVARIRRHAT